MRSAQTIWSTAFVTAVEHQIVEVRADMLRVDHRDDRVERDLLRDRIVEEEGLRDRIRIGEAARLDDDVIEPVGARDEHPHDPHEIPRTAPTQHTQPLVIS